MITIGIDVGGTKIAGVALTDRGAVLHRTWREHRIRSSDALLREVERSVGELRDALRHAGQPQPFAMGLGIASWLTPDGGTIQWAAHFRIREFAVREALEARLGIPVRVDNDGNATGLAEWMFGAGRGEHSLLLVALGTGVGGAIVLDGRPLRGAHGYAGELGHVTVDEEGPACSCEARGCLESFAGGQALARRASALPAAVSRAEGREVTAKDLVDAARAGDDACLGVLDEAGVALARALRRMLPAFDPGVVVLGGSIGIAAHALILPATERELAMDAPLKSVPQPRRIVPAALGPYSTAIGAAALTL